MRWIAVWLGILACSLPAVAAQPLGPLWSARTASVVVTPCPPGGDHDDDCRGVAVRRGSEVKILGGGYSHVTLLWQRTPGHQGPDVLIRGDGGGSGGEGDLIAVTLGPSIDVRRLTGGRIDDIIVADPHGRFAFNLPFGIGYFNGAPNAGETDVPLPIVWRGGDFALDLAALTSRTISREELDFRRLAVQRELNDWQQDDYTSGRLTMPRQAKDTEVTVQAFADLMLSGHADLAIDLLRRAWPGSRDDIRRPIGGEAPFWNALCRRIVRHDYWTRLGLARLPHSDLILAGAAGRSGLPD